MSSCRWDRDAKAHLTPEHLTGCEAQTCKGCQPCTHDDEGTPVHHCRTRLRCTSHLAPHEHTCPTCVGKIRTNLTELLDCLALMPHEAEYRGVDSEPANLAGPHADYVSSQWRLINADRAGMLVEELDMLDPYTCLTMHERTIREMLGHDSEVLVSPTVGESAAYIAGVLTTLARDSEQTQEVMALMEDTAQLRIHAEGALRDSRAPERGAPCPDCAKDHPNRPAPRLVLEFGHWCEDPDCEQQFHYLDETGDRWKCPADPKHWWTPTGYAEEVLARRASGRIGA